MKPPALELRDLSAGYGDIPVLHGVDLTVQPGQVHALVGPNGVGKSTTLAVCSGLIQPTSGEVRLAGRVVTGVASDALARAGLCLVPEGRGVFPNLTVAENIRMFTHLVGVTGDVAERVYSEFPRLAERRRQNAGTLSGGEQQMLAVARALVTDPAVVLIDELSMGLAPLIVEGLYGHVASLAARGISIVVVEQFAHTVLEFADTASLMLGGRVVRSGSPGEIADGLAGDYLASSVPATSQPASQGAHAPLLNGG